MTELPIEILQKILIDPIRKPEYENDADDFDADNITFNLKDAARISMVCYESHAAFLERLHMSVMEASRSTLMTMKVLVQDFGALPVKTQISNNSTSNRLRVHGLPDVILARIREECLHSDKLFFPRKSHEPVTKMSFFDIDDKLMCRFNELDYNRVRMSPESYLAYLEEHREIIELWQTVWVLIILKNSVFVESDEAHDLLIIKSNNQLQHIANKLTNFQHYLCQYPGVNDWFEANIVPQSQHHEGLQWGKFYAHSFRCKNVNTLGRFISILRSIPLVCMINVGI